MKWKAIRLGAQDGPYLWSDIERMNLEGELSDDDLVRLFDETQWVAFEDAILSESEADEENQALVSTGFIEVLDERLWYVIRVCEFDGPFETAELSGFVRAGELKPDDLILPVGGSEWHLVREIPFQTETALAKKISAVEQQLKRASILDLRSQLSLPVSNSCAAALLTMQTGIAVVSGRSIKVVSSDGNVIDEFVNSTEIISADAKSDGSIIFSDATRAIWRIEEGGQPELLFQANKGVTLSASATGANDEDLFVFVTNSRQINVLDTEAKGIVREFELPSTVHCLAESQVPGLLAVVIGDGYSHQVHIVDLKTGCNVMGDSALSAPIVFDLVVPAEPIEEGPLLIGYGNSGYGNPVLASSLAIDFLDEANVSVAQTEELCGRITIWRKRANGINREAERINDSTTGIVDLSCDRHGLLILTCCSDGTVKLWDSHHNEQIAQLTGFDTAIKCVCLADVEDRVLAFGSSEQGTLHRWDVTQFRDS